MSDLRSRWPSLSDREKDALVAEKVMGWKSINPERLAFMDNNGTVYTLESTSYGNFAPSSPNSAAFLQVVEKMLNIRTPEGYHKYQVKIDSDGPHRWSVAFKDDPLHEPLAICPTLCDASCLAALLALGVEA